VNVEDEGLGVLYLSPLNLESTPSAEVLALRTNLNCSAWCRSSGLGGTGFSVLSSQRLFIFVPSFLLFFSFCEQFLRLRRKHQTDELATSNNNNPAATPTNRAKLIFVVPSRFPSVGLPDAAVTIWGLGCVDFSVVSLPMCRDVGRLISRGVGDFVGMVGADVVGLFVAGLFVVRLFVVGLFVVRLFVVGLFVVVAGVVESKKRKSFKSILSNSPKVTLCSLLDVKFNASARLSTLTP
jgi:hypothetical protein